MDKTPNKSRFIFICRRLFVTLLPYMKQGMMIKKGNRWLMMALMATLLACKGNTRTGTAEATDAQDKHDFYASGNVASA